MINYIIPFFIAKKLADNGFDALYFEELYPYYKFIYNHNKDIINLIYTPIFPGDIPAITWKMFILFIIKSYLLKNKI